MMDSRSFANSVLLALCLFIGHSAVLGKSPDQTANAWRTKQFTVRWYSPGISDRLFELGAELVTGVSDEDRMRMSQWDRFIRISLSEIAGFYEANGLAEPLLPIETDENGNERYVVYAYDLSSGFFVSESEEFASGYYSAYLCARKLSKLFSKTIDINPGSPELAINTGGFKDTNLSDLSRDKIQNLYDTLGHELFHAVQANYDKQFSSILWCKDQEENGYFAVVEGTATAASTLASLEKYGGFLVDPDHSLVRFGAFNYGTEEFLKAKSSETARKEGGNPKQAYQTSSFWRYLAERFGGLKVFNTLFRERFVANDSAPTLSERYKWLDTVVDNVSGKEFYLLYPDFQAEFASYDERYAPSLPTGAASEWIKEAYRNGDECSKVDISSETGFYGKAPLGDLTMSNTFATCIQLTWTGLKDRFSIAVEARGKNLSIVDQLHLGIASLETDGNADNCYQEGLNRSEELGRENVECTFGKVFPRQSANGPFTKEWFVGALEEGGVFFARRLGDSGTALLIVTNVATKPDGTEYIDRSEDRAVDLHFSLSNTRFADGRRFDPPVFQPIRNPGLSTALLASGTDRYSFYGIVREDEMVPRSPSLTIGTRATGEDRKLYSLSALAANGLDFGFAGPLNGNVFNESGANSALCQARGGRREERPVGKITKSDDDQLRLELETPLCKAFPDGQIRQVDSISAQFILPFGRRYFASTAPKDVITPGLELYIDQYIEDAVAAGLPVPPGVMLSDGTIPGGGGGNGPDGAPPGGPPTPNQPGNVERECDCTCEGFRKLQEEMAEANRDPTKRGQITSAARCVQKCMSQYSKCRR